MASFMVIASGDIQKSTPSDESAGDD